jgi:hypothetical protein
MGICLAEGFDTPEFGLVGDDVVWFKQVLARRYMKIMSDMGCPISVQKTLESDKMAEFLSCIITPTSIIPSYKWRQTSDDNFLDIARCLGPRSVALFKGKQKRIIRLISDIPEPFGLGWNPKGLSWYDRSSKVPIEPPQLKEFKPVSADHHLMRAWYTNARLSGYLEDLAIQEATSDQDVGQVLTLVFGSIGSSQILEDSFVRDFMSLSSLVEDEYRKFGYVRPEVKVLLPTELQLSLGLDRDPIEVQEKNLRELMILFHKAYRGYSQSPERQTTLDRYEDILKRVILTMPDSRSKQQHVQRRLKKARERGSPPSAIKNANL